MVDSIKTARERLLHERSAAEFLNGERREFTERVAEFAELFDSILPALPAEAYTIKKLPSDVATNLRPVDGMDLLAVVGSNRTLRALPPRVAPDGYSYAVVQSLQVNDPGTGKRVFGVRTQLKSYDATNVNVVDPWEIGSVLTSTRSWREARYVEVNPLVTVHQLSALGNLVTREDIFEAVQSLTAGVLDLHGLTEQATAVRNIA